MTVRILAGDFIPSQALAYDLVSSQMEAFKLTHHALAVVLPKRRFIQVAKQVEGLNVYVGAVQLTLH